MFYFSDFEDHKNAITHSTYFSVSVITAAGMEPTVLQNVVFQSGAEAVLPPGISATVILITPDVTGLNIRTDRINIQSIEVRTFPPYI